MNDRLSASRRSVLAGLATLAGSAAVPVRAAPAAAAAPAGPTNPLVRQRADAQVFRHDDGRYYMTGSVPEYDRLVIRASPTIAGLATADEAVIWRRPTGGKLAGYIWAPELHWFDGRWHMYFAAGDGDDPFRIRTYVLQGRGADPRRAAWALLGQVRTPWDSFTLDSTTFVHRGQRYFCWAQREPGIDSNSNLYLAPLATPTTLAAPPVRLSVPTLLWEIRGFKVNEAPALLVRNGRLFLTYSASATDARYCLGLLTADANADIMAAASWSKSPVPVFETSVATSVYGPGHNSFTVDERGRDILVYHGRDYARIAGDPLFDPNRHTRVQRLYYDADGRPDFGIPVGNGTLPVRLSPSARPREYLMHRGDTVAIGTAALPATQFRLLPGPAGHGTVTLQPVDAPDRRVCWLDGTTAALGVDDGSPAFRERSSLALRARPHARDTFALAPTGPGNARLSARADRAVIAPTDSAGEADTGFVIT